MATQPRQRPPLSRGEAVTQLGAAQKSNRGAGGYSRWINRPLGRHIAAVSYVRGLTPNDVTGLSALLTFPAIVALALLRPNWGTSTVIVLALLAGYAFDSADGQVARLAGAGSPAGEWLDHVFDAAKVSSFHLAVAVFWFRFYGLPSASVLIPLSFSAVSSVFFFALVLSDMLRRVASSGAGGSGVTTASRNPKESAPVLRSILVLPNDYGILCLSLLLAPARDLFLLAYSALLIANVVFLLVGCRRWFVEMRTLGSTESRVVTAP